MAVCPIPNSSKVVAIVNNQIEVHKDIDKSGGSTPIYTLPTPENLLNPCNFQCIGVMTGNRESYVVSDKNNECIHVWRAEPLRQWSESIKVALPSSSGKKPSFKLCIYNNIIYITLFHDAIVYARTLHNNSVMWTNKSCRKPNGLCADASGVYVCDGEGGNRCIQVINLDGTYRQSILEGYIQRPWSVAICDNTLAVLERYFRINKGARKASSISLYHLNEII